MEQCTSPQVKLVGTADEIVLGSLGAGPDLRSEELPDNAEFQADQEVPIAQG